MSSSTRSNLANPSGSNLPMLSQCTDTTAAMMLSYALGGDNSDGGGCWEWSSSVCYLNREAVEEKRRAVLVWV
jgi:hypothetical protein